MLSLFSMKFSYPTVTHLSLNFYKFCFFGIPAVLLRSLLFFLQLCIKNRWRFPVAQSVGAFCWNFLLVFRSSNVSSVSIILASYCSEWQFIPNDSRMHLFEQFLFFLLFCCGWRKCYLESWALFCAKTERSMAILLCIPFPRTFVFGGSFACSLKI
jgi:hypothetical protein